MARVLATCPDCGDVSINLADRHADPRIDLRPASWVFEFDCPDCGESVSQDIGPSTANLLLQCGVDFTPELIDSLTEGWEA